MDTTPAAESASPPSPAIAFPTQDLAIHVGWCLAAGVLFDWFFRKSLPGISVPAFALFVLGAAGWSFRERMRPGLNVETLLSVPILLLAGAFALFTNPVLETINTILLPVLMLLLMLLWSGTARYGWWNPRLGQDMASVLVRTPVDSLRPALALAREAPMRPTTREATAKILIGLACSVPLVFLIVALLTSADQIFSRFLTSAVTFVSLDVSTVVTHTFFILIPALGLSGLLWTMRTRVRGRCVGSEPAFARKWDAIIVSTILVSVNAIYAVFCWIQFSYLFSGAQGALPQGFTYAEYARRGFFELSLVTVLNLAIVTGGVYGLTLSGSAAGRFARAMLTLLVAQSLVILASSFTRLSLYEASYGYTYARIFARTMIVLMGVVLGLLLARTWRETFPFWKCFLLASLAIYCGLNYVNIDRFIAERNAARYEASGKLDVAYLRGLSHEAVPVMAALAKDGNHAVATAMHAELVRRWHLLRTHQSLPELNVSRHRALRLASPGE